MSLPLHYLPRVLGLSVLFSISELSAQIDLDGNEQSDVWERIYSARQLAPSMDADGDGRSNRDEAIVGTDPFDPRSFLKIDFERGADGVVRLSAPEPRAKRYRVYHKTSLDDPEWTLVDQFTAIDRNFEAAFQDDQSSGFYRIEVADSDSDGDGLTDWEEIALGFDPTTAHTDREGDDDLERITDGLTAENRISLHVADGEAYENWPDPAVLVLRRSGGLDPLNVSIHFGGSASAADFAGPSTEIRVPPGYSDSYLQFTPVADALAEATETLTVTLVDSDEYQIDPGASSATITFHDAAEGVSPKEAGRLLAQATFGATETEIASVQALGIEGWIDAQIALAPSLLQSATEAAALIDEADPEVNFYSGSKLVGWWDNVIHAEDQLRQRVAFALSEILVVSDDAGMIDGQPIGMANYYDIFVRNAFGNYRDILEEVTYHPVMGIYLSHKGNRAPDPASGRFPDENYAREIMQLFSIGLWMLNNNGTRILDTDGHPIPTYGNFEISELARVFTGMNWGTNNPLLWWEYSTYPYESERDPYTVPMQFWEGRAQDADTREWLPYREWIDNEAIEYFIRDRGEKVLIDGSTVPAGQSGEQDVSMALDALFEHPNVGPFLARRLIQRLVKSNPSPAYIDRVASAFNDNGSGVRGDLEAVVRAILLDPEARDFANLADPTGGKQREPYLRLVHLGRTFDVASAAGPIVVFWNEDVFQQAPLSSPTVFNFFTPDYAPPGVLQNGGLVAPEFQITTTVSATEVPNEFYWMTRYNVISWFGREANGYAYRPYIHFEEELLLADDPDALIAHLDHLLAYGSLSPAQQSIIRYALQRRINQNRSDNDIVSLAVYLLMTSPDYVIQK